LSVKKEKLKLHSEEVRYLLRYDEHDSVQAY